MKKEELFEEERTNLMCSECKNDTREKESRRVARHHAFQRNKALVEEDALS